MTVKTKDKERTKACLCPLCTSAASIALFWAPLHYGVHICSHPAYYLPCGGGYLPEQEDNCAHRCTPHSEEKVASSGKGDPPWRSQISRQRHLTVDANITAVAQQTRCRLRCLLDLLAVRCLRHTKWYGVQGILFILFCSFFILFADYVVPSFHFSSFSSPHFSLELPFTAMQRAAQGRRHMIDDDKLHLHSTSSRLYMYP